MKNIVNPIRTLNALMIFVIMGVLVAAYYQQYFKHELPCPLCILQRLCMISLAIGLLCNLRFGVKIKHYVLSLLSAFLGGVISGRQICLHICPDFPEFGIPVFGFGLYTWSFIVFACSVLAIFIFLFFYAQDQAKKYPMSFFHYLAFFTVFGITLLNFLTTFKECDFGPCEDISWPQHNEQSKK